ncbi:MAG: alpha/beta hydrolase fold domain-containing protein [Planctomycetaceae bacterium]|nr:alpha/beta hydrolase fold domain-containing protein [Planctomycetaceae bacterium]
MLIPQSLNEKRWTRDEIEFLNKVTEQARQQYNIDPFRIAVGGQTTGGTMASLVAMSQRSTWRGLILINAPAATRVAQFQSEPKQRQMVLIVDATAEEKIAQQMERWTKHFEDQMFPVALLETDPSGIPEMVTQWRTQLARF